MKTQIDIDSQAFQNFEADWNALLAQSASDSLFSTWEWQTTWWEHLGQGELRLISFRDDAGALLGIAPLFWHDSQLALVGCVDVSDYLDLIVARGHEPEVYAALLDVLASADFAAAQRAHFCNLPAASPLLAQFEPIARARGWRVNARQEDVAPFIELPASWDAYLESLDKKQRHEMRRKLRRVAEVEHRWFTLPRDAAAAPAVRDFIELHKRSRPDKNVFMDERMQNFFSAMAELMHARGWLELSFLQIQNQPAAAIFSFVYNNVMLVYNSGYDPQNFGAWSPGVVLFAFSIQDAIAARRRVYDLLQGNEAYKYRLGARDQKIFEIEIQKE
ncbi:MAG: GNAT family N-acetyltransferase [Chloroflexi bacterium]|nr:GNAT family N-acetyltransferase [Chloroflexota bacterium]